MSPELKQFFLEIHGWVEQGCPEHRVFLKTCGLCSTVRWYAFELRQDAVHLEQEFETLLKASAGDTVCPFNRTAEAYLKEQRAEALYKNPTRLAFIKQQVERIKNSVEEQLK